MRPGTNEVNFYYMLMMLYRVMHLGCADTITSIYCVLIFSQFYLHSSGLNIDMLFIRMSDALTLADAGRFRLSLFC